MNDTTTPETDALHEQRREIHSAYFMMVSNARILERERNEARELADRLAMGSSRE